MAFDPNWARWTFASVSNWFDSQKQSYTLFVEGEERKTTGLQMWAEFRMDGPNIKEPWQGFYELDVEISILCSAIRDEKNLHLIHTLVGTMAAAFAEFIPVNKYGTNPQDDQTLLGCLYLQQRGNDKLFISHFGQIDPSMRILQATVDGRYKMTIP